MTEQNKKNGEGSVPFKNLVGLKGIRTLETDTEEYKKKLKKYGDGVAPYDPYLSKERGQQEEVSGRKKEKVEEVFPVPNQEEKKEKPKSFKLERKTEKQPSSQYKDEVTILKDSIIYLSKQHAEWKHKLEYYQTSGSKTLEEKQDFELKKAELEKSLQPILEEEKEIEEKIRQIEEEEKLITDEVGLRSKEKDRWQKEDERQVIEKKKWAQMEDIQTVLKFIEEKNNTYKTLSEKSNESETKIAVLEEEKKKKEVQLRLIEVRALKKEIEEQKNKLVSQISSTEESLANLFAKEKEIIEQKTELEEKERESELSQEQKVLEAKRWELESQLREVEKEKWNISDQQKKTQGMLNEIMGQYDRVSKEEEKSLSQIEEEQSNE